MSFGLFAGSAYCMRPDRTGLSVFHEDSALVPYLDIRGKLAVVACYETLMGHLGLENDPLWTLSCKFWIPNCGQSAIPANIDQISPFQQITVTSADV